jgi:hypothetical protein
MMFDLRLNPFESVELKIEQKGKIRITNTLYFQYLN